MTAQAGEQLHYLDQEFDMATEPLNEYLATKKDIRFVIHSTACRRGYYGKWEINDEKLFLIDLKAYLKGSKEVDLH